VFNATVRKLVAPPIDVMLGAKPDVVLFANFVRLPLPLGAKSIVVIYDLSYVKQPEHATPRLRAYLNRYVPLSLKKSQHIVTISENAKREIIEEYGTDPDKITVAPPAVDLEDFYPRGADEIEKVKAKYNITKPYILYMGTLEPRKNVNGVLNAYAALGEELRDKYTLVLAGGKGWLDNTIKQRLDELAGLDIITTGYVPDEDRPVLDSGAEVFVYPSFYEGFGMPVLEAIACGAPTITANNSSLPEVIGDAGLVVDAKDTAAITHGLERVLNDPELAARMRAKGLDQAKKFSWEESAKKLHEIIEKVGAQQ
jgi:glycosyltransferase involved in cell wall biosynthesis